MNSAPTTERLAYGILIGVLLVALLQGVTLVQTAGLADAVERLIQGEEAMPSRTTRIEVPTSGGTAEDAVTTTFQEPPHQEETRAEWHARHVAEVEAAIASWTDESAPQ